MINNNRKYLIWSLAIGVCLITLFPTLLGSNFIILDQDAWIALYGAKRILEGQLLYKNFFDFVTPGTDYLLADMFYLFGVKLSVARITLAATNTLSVAIVVFIAFSVIKNRALSVLLPLLAAIYASYNYYVSHHWFILLPVILTLFSGIMNIKEQSTKAQKWFFTGLATAGAFLFIQSIGLTLFGMIVLFIIWYYGFPSLFVKGAGYPSRTWVGGILLKSEMYYISGFLIPIIFVVVIFALSGSLSAFIYDSFIWPLLHYKIMNINSIHGLKIVLIDGLVGRGLSPAILNGFIGYLGILLSFGVFIYMWFQYKKGKTPETATLAFVSVVCMGAIFGLVQNPTINHVMVFLPLYLLMMVLLFEYKIFHKNSIIRNGFSLYFFLIAITLVYNSYKTYDLIYDTVANDSEVMQTHVGEVRMIKSYKSSYDISNPYVFLKEMDNKLPKYIFVLYWSPSIYMLTGAENPTPLNTYMPYYNTKEQAMSVIQALKVNHTEIVIIDTTLEYAQYMYKRHSGWAWHDSRIFSPYEPLISYINAHYRLDKAIPGYKIYKLIK